METTANNFCGKWEQMLDGSGKTTGYLCECGHTSPEASRFCPDCGKRMYDDSSIEKSVNAMVRAFADYFAANPEPAEVEEGYYCRIYTEAGTVAEFTDWGVDEGTAKEKAREIAVQHAEEWDDETFIEVHFVCDRRNTKYPVNVAKQRWEKEL